MLTVAPGRPVYLACGVTDLRKSIDALAALVPVTFQLDPCSPALFVFGNRDRTLRQLQWHPRVGFTTPPFGDHKGLLIPRPECSLRNASVPRSIKIGTR